MMQNGRISGALNFEFSEEVSVLCLRLLLGRLESFRLLCKLSDQLVTLLGQLAALSLLAAQGGVGFAQLLLKSGVGP